jgi:hypothetical protein
MTDATWIPAAERLPPEGAVVATKIDDGTGVRNEQPLKRVGRLWFFPDGSMYVYYTPTHWREGRP